MTEAATRCSAQKNVIILNLDNMIRRAVIIATGEGHGGRVPAASTASWLLARRGRSEEAESRAALGVVDEQRHEATGARHVAAKPSIGSKRQHRGRE